MNSNLAKKGGAPRGNISYNLYNLVLKQKLKQTDQKAPSNLKLRKAEREEGIP